MKSEILYKNENIRIMFNIKRLEKNFKNKKGIK